MLFSITKVKCQYVKFFPPGGKMPRLKYLGLPLTAKPQPFSDRTETNEKLHC